MAASRRRSVRLGDGGDAGNANDTDIDILGGVGYEYRISRHEVTNRQYAEFLDKVASTDVNELFHPEMEITRSRALSSPASTSPFIGFRVTSVPEPSSLLCASFAMFGMMALSRRSRQVFPVP